MLCSLLIVIMFARKVPNFFFWVANWDNFRRVHLPCCGELGEGVYF